jgi:hypothetical protein
MTIIPICSHQLLCVLQLSLLTAYHLLVRCQNATAVLTSEPLSRITNNEEDTTDFTMKSLFVDASPLYLAEDGSGSR